jgi:4-coumarate--CoA ligase
VNLQISPSEIEVIIEQIPGVLAVTITGVPDLITTDLPAALVVRKSEELTAEFIYDYVAQNVSNHKLLRGGVYFVNQLPLTHSGKVMRREAKEIATERYLQMKSRDE